MPGQDDLNPINKKFKIQDSSPLAHSERMKKMYVCDGLLGQYNGIPGALRVSNGGGCIQFNSAEGVQIKLSQSDLIHQRFIAEEMSLQPFLVYRLMSLVSTQKQVASSSQKKTLLSNGLKCFGQDIDLSEDTLQYFKDMVAEIKLLMTTKQTTAWLSFAANTLALIPENLIATKSHPWTKQFDDTTSAFSVTDPGTNIKIIVGLEQGRGEDNSHPLHHLKHKLFLCLSEKKSRLGNDQDMVLGMVVKNDKEAETSMFKHELILALESDDSIHSLMCAQMPSHGSIKMKNAASKKRKAEINHLVASLRNEKTSCELTADDLKIVGLFLRVTVAILYQKIPNMHHAGPMCEDDVDRSDFRVQLFEIDDAIFTIWFVHETWSGGITSWKTGSAVSLNNPDAMLDVKKNDGQKVAEQNISGGCLAGASHASGPARARPAIRNLKVTFFIQRLCLSFIIICLFEALISLTVVALRFCRTRRYSAQCVEVDSSTAQSMFSYIKRLAILFVGNVNRLRKMMSWRIRLKCHSQGFGR